MRETTKQLIKFRFFFYIGAAVVIFAVSQFQKHVAGSWIEPVVAASSLQVEEKGLEAFQEMNRLITTLATAVLGAIGFFFFNLRQPRHTLSSMWAAYGSAVSAFLSLYFGYVVYLALLSMLQIQLPFNPESFPILWPRQAQFYTFLLSVVFFADFAFHNMEKEENHAPMHQLAGH